MQPVRVTTCGSVGSLHGLTRLLDLPEIAREYAGEVRVSATSTSLGRA